MTDGKIVKVKTPDGEDGTGVEVDVTEAVERWSDITLADGTKFRVKLNVSSMTRIDGHYDAAGNPAYIITAQPSVVMTEVPDALKKPS